MLFLRQTSTTIFGCVIPTWWGLLTKAGSKHSQFFFVIIINMRSMDLSAACIRSTVKARWLHSPQNKFFPLDYATKAAGRGDNERVQWKGRRSTAPAATSTSHWINVLIYKRDRLRTACPNKTFANGASIHRRPRQRCSSIYSNGVIAAFGRTHSW